MKVVITGGGTGGHIYPALSIIEGLKAKYSDLEVIYIGTKGRMESVIVPELGIEYVGLEMQGFNRKNIFKNFKLLYLLIKNYFILKNIYKSRNIDVVIGTGGYVTVPVVYTASKMKIPTLIFDADVDFGMATRKLLNYANVVCSGFEKPSLNNDKVIYTGNPRAQLVNSKIKRNVIDNKVLYVFGSLGSETINAFFKDYFNNKVIDYDVKYVTGKGMFKDFIKDFNNERVEVVEYVDDITSELADVSYVVTRSGATFVSELCALAIPAIYIPSPYVANNEQVKNVEDLVESNLASVILENDLSVENFDSKVNWMNLNRTNVEAGLKENRKIDSLDIIVMKVEELVNE